MEASSSSSQCIISPKFYRQSTDSKSIKRALGLRLPLSIQMAVLKLIVRVTWPGQSLNRTRLQGWITMMLQEISVDSVKIRTRLICIWSKSLNLIRPKMPLISWVESVTAPAVFQTRLRWKVVAKTEVMMRPGLSIRALKIAASMEKEAVISGSTQLRPLSWTSDVLLQTA